MPPIAPFSFPKTPITLPIPLVILPNAINTGLATATTPNITAITFLTGLGNSPKALATVLIPLARVEITGAKASPNSIAEFFTSLKATCNL